VSSVFVSRVCERDEWETFQATIRKAQEAEEQKTESDALETIDDEDNSESEDEAEISLEFRQKGSIDIH